MTWALDLSEETISNSSIEDLMFTIADIAMDEEMATLKMKLRGECDEFLRGRLREIKGGEPQNTQISDHQGNS